MKKEPGVKKEKAVGARGPKKAAAAGLKKSAGRPKKAVKTEAEAEEVEEVDEEVEEVDEEVPEETGNGKLLPPSTPIDLTYANNVPSQMSKSLAPYGMQLLRAFYFLSRSFFNVSRVLRH